MRKREAASYQLLLDLIDRLEAVVGIQRGLDDVNQGRTQPIEKFIADKKKRIARAILKSKRRAEDLEQDR